MKFDNIFLHFYNSKAISDFITKINSLKRGFKDIKKTGYPSRLSTLLSFNFKNKKIVNFKVYCEIFREFNDNEILQFLPESENFKKYFKFWNRELPSSLCFGIKINRKLIPTQYFHIKFIDTLLPEFKDCKIFKERPTFNRTGISFEYEKNKIVKKYYFYYTNKEDISYFLEKNNINEKIENVDHIEFTEFDTGEQKIIVVYHYQNFSSFDVIREKFYNVPSIKRSVEYFKQTHDILPSYIGIYKNTTLGIYWSISSKPLLYNNILHIDPNAF